MPINSFEVHGLVVSRLILYDLAVEVKKNLVAYIPLAGIGAVAALRANEEEAVAFRFQRVVAVAALRKETMSRATGRADAGQTRRRA